MTDFVFYGDTERSYTMRHELPVVIGDPFLLAIVDGGTNWLGRPRLAARSLELLAALMALAAGWRNDGRASALLALAAASNDPDIRNAANPTPRTTAAMVAAKR